ncbi:MAG: hypothetical protein M3R38_11320 [Actinomycetota bacterium]|nr:hypothetical protein [Actinomycetota bacterium]
MALPALPQARLRPEPGEPWHTPESCDRRMAHLDDALDDRPRAVDLMRVRF